MKALFLTSVSLFAMTACTVQAPPPAAPGAPLVPTTVAGSAANTTTAFDGIYQGLAISGNSGLTPGLQALDRTHRDVSRSRYRQP